jgi:hypothetical protein
MRRLLALSLLAAAAFGAAPAAHADVTCTQVASTTSVCYQVTECVRTCRVHVIVDPQCSDEHQTIWCRTIDGVTVDSDKLKL